MLEQLEWHAHAMRTAREADAAVVNRNGQE
jgi:hypothetical protein